MKPDQKLIRRMKRFLLAHREELVKPAYRDMFRLSYPLGGLCYVASEVYYYMKGKRQGYRPMVGRLDDGFTHWWLQDDELSVIDLVYGDSVWGKIGKMRRAAFLTQKPSKRAMKVIRALRREMV